jgi:hypothetical protein
VISAKQRRLRQKISSHGNQIKICNAIVVSRVFSYLTPVISVLKDPRSPDYLPRYRDPMGREITGPTREKDKEKSLAVALHIESQIGSQNVLKPDILHSPIVSFHLDQHAPHAGLVLNRVAEEIPRTEAHIATGKAFSTDQIRALLRACDTLVLGDEWIGVLAIAISIGGALSTIAHLRVQNLLRDGDHPLLSIPNATQPGDAPSLNPIHPLLYDYLLMRCPGDDSAAYLFQSLAAREAVAPGFLVEEFEELLIAAGIERSGVDQHFPERDASVEECSADSLRHPLDREQASAIMNTAFSTRFKRYQARRFEQLFALPRKSPRQQFSDSKVNTIFTRVI